MTAAFLVSIVDILDSSNRQTAILRSTDHSVCTKIRPNYPSNDAGMPLQLLANLYGVQLGISAVFACCRAGLACVEHELLLP